MSELDSLLENYCKCTDCTCADCNCGNSQEVRGLEANVRARLHALGTPILQNIFPRGTFRPAAITAGLMMGIASISITTSPALSAQQNGLMIFSPNSPDWPSTLFGRSN
jgi:hypothetical protein